MLLEKTSDTNVWPRDNMLHEKILNRPIYIDEKSRSIVNILLEIEISTRGSKQEKVAFINDGLTIEHLLPQNWFENWPLDDEFITEEDFNIAIHAVMTESDENGKYHKIINSNMTVFLEKTVILDFLIHLILWRLTICRQFVGCILPDRYRVRRHWVRLDTCKQIICT